jgi:hypothetical protein
MSNNNWSYSFSWTQPYPSMNPVYQLNVVNEIARLDFLEDEIQEMTHYPDAEKIIQKVIDAGRNDSGGDDPRRHD